MTLTTDPLERLRAANPVPPEEVAGTSPDPVLFRAVVSGALEDVPGRRARPASRRRRLLVPAVAVLGLLGGTVAYALLREPVPKPQNAGCYEAADLEARTLVVGVGPEGPLGACAELWRQGVLGRGGEVPPLRECVLSTGVVGVFPVPRAGDDVCRGLVGPPATGAPEATTASTTALPPADVNERFRIFREAVLPQFLGVTCVEPQRGTDIVRRELDRAGLGEWRVTSAGEFPADRPCATLGFRPDRREVVLIPSPPRR